MKIEIILDIEELPKEWYNILPEIVSG